MQRGRWTFLALPIALLIALLLAAAACAPRVRTPEPVTATVVLPSLERCLHAGRGATLAFDGERLGWTCESPVDAPRGLVGQPVVQDGVDVTWRLIASERDDDGAFVVERDEVVQARAVQLVLATGETCAFAGLGATLAFDGERVNYTCPDDVVVVGDLIADANGLLAVRGTLERRDGVSRLVEPLAVRVISLTLE